MVAKGCYTCRRRRIICDNGQPTCQKCRDAGKECLGYQKPLVWVKGGVASRGKMMGRSFEEVTKKNPRRAGEPNELSAPAPTENMNPPSTVEVFNQSVPNTSNQVAVPYSSNALPVPGSSGAAQQRGKNTGHISASRNISTTDDTHILPSLIDPILKDINGLARFYIFHFNEKTAADLVLYANTQNPYRDLISLVGESPLLANALSATGALHYALLADGDFSPMPWSTGEPSANGTLLTPKEVEREVTSSMSRRPSSKAYEHFLGLKQRALRQLSQDIRDPVKRNDDKTAAAIMVLALMDAIESGDEAWKYHLEGAKNLLNSRQHGFDASRSQEILGWLDTLTVDGCLIIELMGSTLARPGVLSKPFYSPSMGPTALRRLEKTSWVGCPAYLLEVIFFVHARFCHADTTTTTHEQQGQQEQPPMLFSSSLLPPNSKPLQSPQALLNHIQAFDPIAWAIDLQSYLYLPDLTPRIALATTYKAAVYLYTSRVLSRPRSSSSFPPANANANEWFGLPHDHSAVAHILIDQLAVIPPQDPHFKCLIWPTFIAGAECRDSSHRPFILDRLSALYYAIATVNVRNAAWVLSLMWRKQDLRREEWFRRRQGNTDYAVAYDGDNYDNDDFDWIQELDESRIDWLFI
ncbi:Zn(II)2Cys6 transcription factor [Aspergillus glaucus CBS 516.65]|uniref:Zn(2)-C6 fungal-type domain-containing protein n=1 Tax=Aspergillus glaucus CBS 516.65 TaxID=1160497 RepID=A0A1L9VU34_ASPGL|nr:hypothetical protein ASPGLDRAFT_144343 [Aspergillus glaucus CBS 516.65]OJJ87438.1 hypothetical protein ASPGLDRAFT_144343 [Aspergillus glaucus CBS 516.65]